MIGLAEACAQVVAALSNPVSRDQWERNVVEVPRDALLVVLGVEDLPPATSEGEGSEASEGTGTASTNAGTEPGGGAVTGAAPPSGIR